MKMGTKKIVGITLSGIVLMGVGTASGMAISSLNNNNTRVERKNHKSKINKPNKEQKTDKVSSSSDKKKTTSSSATTPAQSFDKLPQTTQLALLIHHQSFTVGLDKPMTNTHYFPLMGVPNKIVIFNDGGAGTDIEHSFMITDNHDDTYSFSTVSSVAETSAFQTDKNSWWQFKSKVSKA